MNQGWPVPLDFHPPLIWEENLACEEYKSMVKGKAVEAEWKYLDVNEHWQQMTNIMMETAQFTCGLSNGP